MRVFIFISALLCAAAQAADLSGPWEVQSMGSDRDMQLEQKGNKLVAHRILWPEFEGEKYKLEHLYRGTLNGAQIKGQLLVKEDGQKNYEVLRDFVGSIGTDGKVILDGLPLSRQSGASSAVVPPPAAPVTSPTPPAKPAAPVRPSEAPELTQNQDPGDNLFRNIMGSPGSEGLFKVSNSITIPNRATDLTNEGDSLFQQGKSKEALAKYEEAANIEGSSQSGLLHKMGRCHLALKEFSAAKNLLKRALKLDPQNPELRQDYEKSKHG